PFSEKTAETFDAEVKAIIEGSYTRAKELLNTHKDQLTQLAKHLLEKEVIFKEDLENIFGKRPFEKEEEKPTISSENLMSTAQEETNNIIGSNINGEEKITSAP
ncbi:MAG TPA: peptidase M41, partial [Bacteroidia bacterium]|nr:peptidase M41 [Bacteroidia bacterium]